MIKPVYKYIYFILIISLFSCSDEKLIDYKVPEFSIKDYCDQINKTKKGLIEKYPYAISQYYSNEVYLNTKIKGDTENAVNKTEFHYYPEDKCSSINISCNKNSEDIHRFFYYLDKINSFTNELKSMSITYKTDSNSDKYVIFSSIKEVKRWLTDNMDKEIDYIHCRWIFRIEPDKDSYLKNIVLYITEKHVSIKIS